MKFLTEKGKIEEGTPLTDEQVLQRTNLIAYFHETACEGAYHGTYSARPCENLANAFVTGAIAEVANKQPEPEPLPLPEPSPEDEHPLPHPTGVEDEVLGPLTAWEREEEERKIRLAGKVKMLENMANFADNPGIELLEETIAIVENYDTTNMQEYRLSAESAVAAVLKRLKPELERRKVAEAERVELERLRKESAATAEADRQAEAKRREDERIAAAVEAAKVATRQEVIAEIARAETVEEPDGPGEDEPFEPQPTASDPERVPTPVFTRHTETREQEFNREAVAGLMGNCYIDRQKAIQVLTAITKGLIPHVSITY